MVSHKNYNLEGEVLSIWDLYPSGLQECKGNVFFEVGPGGQHFSIGFKKILGGGRSFAGGLPPPGTDTTGRSL